MLTPLSLTPRQIVEELDKYIIGQQDAKRNVAIALRNRIRRMLVTSDIQKDIVPNNILLIGSTGVGKTEIARAWPRLPMHPLPRWKHPSLPKWAMWVVTWKAWFEIW